MNLRQTARTMGELDVVQLDDGHDASDAPSVVLMHGFGAPGTDLVPLARAMQVPSGTRFYFPAALHLLPPALGGGVGRAWWHIDMVRLQMAMMTGQARDFLNEEPEGLAEAHRAALQLLQLVHAERNGPLFLGGFSQGAMLATDLALRTELDLAGLLLFSGTYLSRDVWTPLMPGRRGLKVVQAHGTDDPILPFALAEMLRDALREAGLEVNWVEFPGGHGIPGPALVAASALVSEPPSP